MVQATSPVQTSELMADIVRGSKLAFQDTIA
jgi:hypothetical protein